MVIFLCYAVFAAIVLFALRYALSLDVRGIWILIAVLTGVFLLLVGVNELFVFLSKKKKENKSDESHRG